MLKRLGDLHILVGEFCEPHECCVCRCFTQCSTFDMDLNGSVCPECHEPIVQAEIQLRGAQMISPTSKGGEVS